MTRTMWHAKWTATAVAVLTGAALTGFVSPAQSADRSPVGQRPSTAPSLQRVEVYSLVRRAGQNRTVKRFDARTKAALPAFVTGAGIIRLSPDGKVLYVVGRASVRSFNSETGALLRKTTLGMTDITQADITADGTRLWFTDVPTSGGNADLYSWDTATGVLSPGVATGLTFGVRLYLSSDGITGYLFDFDQFELVDLRSGQVGPPQPLPGQLNLLALRVMTGPHSILQRVQEPDMTNSYFADVALPSGAVLRRTPDTYLPVDIDAGAAALGPTGTRAFDDWYFQDTADRVQTSIDLTHMQVLASKQGEGRPQDLAVGPTDDTGFVTSQGVDQVDVLRLPSFAAAGALPTPDGSGYLSVTPTQAPVAAFTASVTGRKVTLHGSASRGVTAAVTSWRWQFGDGASATTSKPTTTHSYAATGQYSVRLTVTDADGTSTTQVYDGRAMIRNGGPAATTTKNIDVG